MLAEERLLTACLVRLAHLPAAFALIFKVIPRQQRPAPSAAIPATCRVHRLPGSNRTNRALVVRLYRAAFSLEHSRHRLAALGTLGHTAFPLPVHQRWRTAESSSFTRHERCSTRSGPPTSAGSPNRLRLRRARLLDGDRLGHELAVATHDADGNARAGRQLRHVDAREQHHSCPGPDPHEPATYLGNLSGDDTDLSFGGHVAWSGQASCRGGMSASMPY